ncbi:MAG: hypothetical protein N2C12_00990, partial [Planctomycetales bacterium]
MKRYRLVFIFLKQLFVEQPRQMALAFLLMLAMGTISGVGILLLIPMLQIIGADNEVASAGLSRGAINFLQAVGLPVSLRSILLIFMGIALGHAL